MDTFDFVVVGAGSAGCVIANRLSEGGRHTVALIEAGGKAVNPFVKIPLAAGLVYFWPSINWGYETAPDPGLNGRSIKWPRGKVLGGSSTINGMMYMRGDLRDYDDWGQPGWSAAEVLPAFLKSEDHVDRTGPFHARGGPLRVQRSKGDHDVYRAFLEAGRMLGLPMNDDFNGESQEGLGLFDFNIRDGVRESSATAFLTPATGRANLAVITHRLVSRVVLEGARATGVELIRDGVASVIRARREVILAAGTIGSPAILQRSGIGDPADLGAVGVPVAHALPGVGRNLHDHCGVYLKHRSRKANTLYALMRPDRAVVAGLGTLLLGRGPGSSVPLEAGGFLKTRPDLDRPDIHIVAVPGLNLEATQKGQGQHGYIICFYQGRPKSRGRLAITSAHPGAAPRIEPGYLSHADDVACMRDGVKLALRIAAAKPLAELDAGPISPLPEEVKDDASIDAWVRANANTIFHPVGTCAMGSVTDHRLKVRGIGGLRVADASVMPQVINGNTSAPAMMIGERAAEWATADVEFPNSL